VTKVVIFLIWGEKKTSKFKVDRLKLKRAPAVAGKVFFCFFSTTNPLRKAKQKLVKDRSTG